MSRTVQAVFDGEVFRPTEEVDLEPNTRVRITIEESDAPKTKAYSFLDTAASLNLEGPPDWSERIDEYLYGHSLHDDETKPPDSSSNGT
jgi:predicted DNA-binding antitoxin AbrB/MazE fold protein